MSAAPPNPILSRQLHLSECIESSLDGIVVFDQQYRLVIWNPAMERITGINRQEVLGHSAFDLFPFLKKIGADKQFEAVMTGQSVVADRVPFSFPATGRRGFAQAHYSPMRDEHGNVVGGLTIIRDVSAQKRTHDR